jgi:hypothetical protein
MRYVLYLDEIGFSWLERIAPKSFSPGHSKDAKAAEAV